MTRACQLCHRSLVVLHLADPLFTVSQTEQALITQLGKPIRPITKAGLHAKLPFVQSVITFDRRLLDYDLPPEEVILADQRRLIVDGFMRFRITDPLQYYQAVGPTEEGIRARLNSVVSSSMRRVLGNEQLLNVLSSERGRIMGLIRDQVNSEMRGFGVDHGRRPHPPCRPARGEHAGDARPHAVGTRAGGQASAGRGGGSPGAHPADAERDRTVFWPRRARTPTSCAVRARRSRSTSTPRRWGVIPASSGPGARCRRIGMRSRRRLAPGADAGRRLPQAAGQAPPLSATGEAAAAPAPTSGPACPRFGPGSGRPRPGGGRGPGGWEVGSQHRERLRNSLHETCLDARHASH